MVKLPRKIQPVHFIKSSCVPAHIYRGDVSDYMAFQNIGKPRSHL